jgi:hypothetical protein
MIKLLELYSRISPMSWLDRQRGTTKVAEKIPKLLALFGMGYLCAAYTGHWFDWRTPLYMVAIWAGHGIGFGQPIGFALSGVNQAEMPNPPKGAEYEPWQITNLLKQNPWVALFVRGLFVGFASLIAFDPVASIKIALAFGLAFPLASYIVRFHLKMPASNASEHAVSWAKQEEIRGALIELILIGFLWLTLIEIIVNE